MSVIRWWFSLAVASMAIATLAHTAPTAATQPAAICAPSAIVDRPNFPPPVVDQATPSPVATPVASGPMGVPVEDEVQRGIEAVTANYAACQSDGDGRGIVELTSAAYRGDVFGGGERLSASDFLRLWATAPVVEMTIVDVQPAEYSGLRTVSADVTFIFGHQLRVERWTYLFRPVDAATPATPTAVDEERGRWLIHRAEPLAVPVPSGATRIEASLDEYTITLDETRVSGPDIHIVGRNDGLEAHELLVVQLDAGTSSDTLLRPPPDAFPSGVRFIGQVPIEPGASAELILVGLAPGTYTIVCLFPDDAGVPHLAYGQEATFTVAPD